jgi:nitrate reductase gamma subunit
MNMLISIILIAVLVGLVFLGLLVFNLSYLFGIIIPYTAMALFIFGLIYRIIKWACLPVPFHIPTVCGQQKSLPWIKNNSLESPTSTGGVVARMLLEVLFFRSLFRNDEATLEKPRRLIYKGRRLLWLGSLVFHWSLLIIIFRHLRLVLEPVPSIVLFVQGVDGILQQPWATLFITDFVVLIALTYLFLRRVVFPQLRYISLAVDYFAVMLIFAVALSGVLMRTIYQVDVVAIKDLAMGVLSFHPVLPEGISLAFYIHLFLVCSLIAYFPYSKLIHMAGVMLSPTRNLRNDSRMRHYSNPWDRPVKVHTYEEYEDEFRKVMKKADLPVEKE